VGRLCADCFACQFSHQDFILATNSIEVWLLINVSQSFAYGRIEVRMNFVNLPLVVIMTERVIELNKSGKENTDNSTT
jgi:hypothetical protein